MLLIVYEIMNRWWHFIDFLSTIKVALHVNLDFVIVIWCHHRVDGGNGGQNGT